MKMSDEDRESLYGTLGTLQEMVENEMMDPQWYYKALVDGAHQHLIAKELGNAITLLGKVPPAYYRDVIAPHMEHDACYADQVFEIARVLVNQNVVHVGLSEAETAMMQDV
jgi:hypothetical protein